MWHDDDRFWKTFGPFMFNQQRWTNTPVEAEAIVNLLSPPPQATILDLCCGPGRHALELSRKGFRVVGVDRTAAYIAEAKQRAKVEKLKIEFVREDMRRFCRPAAFDFALNLYTAFGYFRNPEEDRRVLVHLHRSLKPGGALLMEMMGKEVLAARFRERDWHEDKPSSFGFTYTVYAGDIAELLADADFVARHVRGIELVASSWGWDVHAAGRLPHPHPKQRWHGCAIRLYKAALSAKLFHHAKLFDSLAVFARGLLDTGETFTYDGEDLSGLFRRRRQWNATRLSCPARTPTPRPPRGRASERTDGKDVVSWIPPMIPRVVLKCIFDADARP